MHNCIASYTSDLGIRLLGAVIDTAATAGHSDVVLNFEAIRGAGLQQLLGARNANADKVLEPGDLDDVLAALNRAGIADYGMTTGLPPRR